MIPRGIKGGDQVICRHDTFDEVTVKDCTVDGAPSNVK